MKGKNIFMEKPNSLVKNTIWPIVNGAIVDADMVSSLSNFEESSWSKMEREGKKIINILHKVSSEHPFGVNGEKVLNNLLKKWQIPGQLFGVLDVRKKNQRFTYTRVSCCCFGL